MCGDFITKLFLLLCLCFAVDCYSCQKENEWEAEKICKWLNQKEVKQLVIAESGIMRLFRRWHLKNEDIDLKDVKESEKIEKLIGPGGTGHLRLEVGSDRHVLYPTTFLLLQQADIFVDKVYFVGQTSTCYVDAKKLREHFEQKECASFLKNAETSTEYKGESAGEKVRNAIAKWKQQHKCPQAPLPRESVTKPVENQSYDKKFFLIGGGLCLFVGIMIGVLLERLRVQYC